MTYWIHLRDDVLMFGVTFLIIIMYLFYVRYPYNREKRQWLKKWKRNRPHRSDRRSTPEAPKL